MAKKKIKKDGKLKKRGLIKKVTGKITKIEKTSTDFNMNSHVVFTPHGITDGDGEILDVRFTEE